MTHSQESRVSSSQDTFRLTEESISRRMQFINETVDECNGAFQSPLCLLSSANYHAGIFALPCRWDKNVELDSPAVHVSTLNDLPYSSMENKSVSALVNRLNSCLAVGTDVFDENDKLEKMAATSNQDEKKLEATYPWLAAYGDLCRSAVGSKSIKRLEHLLSVYLGNVAVNVKDCYMKPNRASKLKKCMNETLVFFHLFYQDIREPMEHSSYLDKMTELVSMYMDMEIKASRRRKESLKKIACRLTSSLYVFLDNSEDHILDAILKAKLVNKHYRDVCVPMLGKILNNVRTYPLYEMLYVRYLLVFKMWKKVVADAEERKHINKIAVQKLSPPPNFMEKSKIFNNVLPKIPKSKKNITLFFMQAKFNLKNACTAFLKGCKDSQQSGFSQNLSVNMDKPLFFSERLTQVAPTLSDKNEDMDGSGSSNLINDIWSSISNVDSGLTENSQLQDLSGTKSKPVPLAGKKKQKDKSKKKQKKKNEAGKNKAKSINKGKKKKLKKKNSTKPGNTASVLSDATFSNTSLLKKSGKGEKVKKKKKKKSVCSKLGSVRPVPCDAGTDESVCMLEPNPTVDLSCQAISQPPSECIAPPASQALAQAVPPVSSQSMCQELTPQVTAPVEERLLDVKVEVAADVEVEVEAVAAAQVNYVNCIDALSQTQVMVNQVNSAGENTIDTAVKASCSEEVENEESGKSNEQESLNQVNQVNSAGCIDESPEQNRVTVIATGVRDPVVPSSSCGVTESLATSQNSGPVNQENEAVPSEVSKKSDDLGTDAVLPRTVRDPVLVPSQITSDVEAVSYACDSSIKNEVPMSESDCAPVGSDDFNSVPMEIDSDVEILAELRPQVAVKCDGVAEEEIVLSDDGEIMRQESQLDNIFATENADLVIEMLGGVLPGGLQVPSMELDNSHSEEGGEPESPEIETFDVYETLSLTDMMNNFLRSKGDYSQYGGERRDCLYRDSMLHPGMQSNYERLAALQESVNANHFMEDDECDEATTDDELESCYELNHSHSTYAHNKRPCIKGGKVGFNGAVSSNGYASVGMNDKVSDSSPSSSIENESALDSSIPSKNSYVASRNNVYNSTNDSIAVVSGRDTPSHPNVGLNAPALSTARSPVSSTPKRISDVNTMRYYTSTLDQAVQSESDENRTASSSLQELQSKRPPTPKKTPTSTCAEEERTEGVVPREVDSTYLNRRVTVQLTQLSPDSAAGVFPDVVLDAHKVSGQREKETMKAPSRGMLADTTNIRGKLTRPYLDGLYRGVPLSAPNVPTSIPYPAITTPLTVGKPPLSLGQYVRCTCSECYASHVMFLSKYNPPPQGGERFATIPVQYRDTSMETDVDKLKSAEKMKSEDEELLRRIEESLADSKCKTETNVQDEVESKYKPELDSSLPLKKRLKTLAHITETKVKPETVDSTKTESFPSYPTRPMISIAELDFNKSLLTKQIQRPIKTSPNNSQRYIQYSHMNYYQAHLQSRELMRKMHNDFVAHYRQYNSEVVASQPGNVVVNASQEPQSFGDASIAESEQGEKVSNRYQQMQREMYFTKERTGNEVTAKEENLVTQPNTTMNTLEYSGRQFKTPAQLKEIPVNNTFQYPDMPVVMKPDPSRTPSQVTSTEVYYTLPKQEANVDHKLLYAQYNKFHALDLSVDDPTNSNESQKSHRKKKKGSEGRTRSSKRSSSSRSHSVIQNAETVDDFMKSFEKKRRRKHVSR